MKLNFEAPARVTEALLPLLRATAASTPADTNRPVCIVRRRQAIETEAWRHGRP